MPSHEHATKPSAGPTPAPLLSDDLLRRFDVPGPRYTSYPTADRFVEAFGADESCAALRQRAERTLGVNHAPLSVYVHIPFCESVCYYCACNKVITKHHDRARRIPRLLWTARSTCTSAARPRAAGVAAAPRRRLADLPVRRRAARADVHRCAAIPALRRAHGDVDRGRSAHRRRRERLAQLPRMGFNRISFGVQDFDAEVQQAVHRVQPFEGVRELMSAARELGFQSINVDLIYGLPQADAASLRTHAGADRPNCGPTASRCTPMRTCRSASSRSGASSSDDLPQRDAARDACWRSAITGFLARGYSLHRHGPFRAARRRAGGGQAPGAAAPQLPGLQHPARLRPDRRWACRPSARVGATYSQNAKTLPEYYDALRQGQLAGACAAWH